MHGGTAANNAPMRSGKVGLPFPYDQDLTGIVTRVKGKREATRTALVNSPKVAAYLRAGATLVDHNLGVGGDAAGDATGKPSWSGIRFLTERAVVAEMENNPPPFLSQKGDGPFRATWASHDDYTHDLLAFLFHAMNYEPQYGEGPQTRADWLATDPSFASAVDRASYGELAELCRMPLFRLQLIMVAGAERNNGIHDTIADNYGGALEPWQKIYESTFAIRGFQLRPGITAEEITSILAALAEGFALRHLGDPGAGILGNGAAGNLFGKAILGILHSYLEPKAEPTGRSLRADFDERADWARRDAGS
ncbi:MAG: hypothetical protein QOC94_2456 [Actinoplanes sp.]|nr:hypothetical protein [Actinoplanes sp.]